MAFFLPFAGIPGGPTGAAGSVWYNGNGVPSSGLGGNADYYLDDLTGKVYSKSTGSCVQVATLGSGSTSYVPFTATTASYTLPANCVGVWIRPGAGGGGGGGGGGAGASASTGGGGAGGPGAAGGSCSLAFVPLSITSGTVLDITIGAGGTG